jgi:hypothetical protein
MIHEPENLPKALLHEDSSRGGNMESVNRDSLIIYGDQAFLLPSSV